MIIQSYAELDKEIVKEDYSTHRKQFFDALKESKKFKRCTGKEINEPYTILHYCYLGSKYKKMNVNDFISIRKITDKTKELLKQILIS